MISDERREEHRRQITRTFGCYARFYDLIEWVVPFMRNNPRLVIARAVDPSATMILDACTGNGAVLAALAASHPSAAVLGLDLSPDMLMLAGRRIKRRGLANVQLHTGDCTRMPFDESTFDAVTASYGLHEMPADVRRAAVDEAFRVLRPGGCLFVIDWDEPRGILGRPFSALRDAIEPDWIVEIFGDGLARIISEAGFKNVAVRRDVFLSQLVIGTKPDRVDVPPRSEGA